MPVGAFVMVHLLTNASVLGGAAAFQSRVDLIHSLGPLLPTIEWLFIFLPMLFHAIMGFVIITTGMPNLGSYSYMGKCSLYFATSKWHGCLRFYSLAYNAVALDGCSTWWREV